MYRRLPADASSLRLLKYSPSASLSGNAAWIGFLTWNELPDLMGLGGMLFITAAGIIVARERAMPAPLPPSGVPIIEPGFTEPDKKKRAEEKTCTTRTNAAE